MQFLSGKAESTVEVMISALQPFQDLKDGMFMFFLLRTMGIDLCLWQLNDKIPESLFTALRICGQK
jgi:hypothetical protein